MAFRPVTHVLFDMDGLLLSLETEFEFGETKSEMLVYTKTSLLPTPQTNVHRYFAADTEELYTVAFQNIVSRYGKNYTFDLKLKLMGLQSHETAKMIISELELPMTIEEFMEESKKQFDLLFPDSQLMPGAMRLIQHFHKSNVPIALATSSSKESYDLKVNKHHKELFELFPTKTFGSSDPEVKRGKPHPDIFLVSANRFPDKPKSEQCLVFEDAVNGVKAARAAGMQVVMVPDPRVNKSLTVEATLVLDSLLDFKPELFGLPPFSS